MRNWPILSTSLFGVSASQLAMIKKTSEYASINSLRFAPCGRYGATAISKGTDAARGMPRPGPIERYISIVKIIANFGPTRPARLSSPFDLATTITPSTGSTTAVIRNPNTAAGIRDAEFCPRNGGKIRLPAPKNNENSIKLISIVCLFVSFIFNPFVQCDYIILLFIVRNVNTLIYLLHDKTPFIQHKGSFCKPSQLFIRSRYPVLQFHP